VLNVIQEGMSITGASLVLSVPVHQMAGMGGDLRVAITP
jgi:hypothetical protein